MNTSPNKVISGCFGGGKFALKNDLYPLLKLAIPLALTGIVGASTGFFETMFLAKLGQDILAAGALVSWLYATFAVILFGTLGSINILVSHKHGATDQINRIFFELFVIFSLIFFTHKPYLK